MTDKEINELGKQEYAKWRQERDKTNYLKAQDKVAGLNENWVKLKENNPEKYQESLDTMVDMSYKLFEGRADARKYKSYIDKTKIKEEMRKEMETTGDIDFNSRAKKFKDSLPKGSSLSPRQARRLIKEQEQRDYREYKNSRESRQGIGFSDWKYNNR